MRKARSCSTSHAGNRRVADIDSVIAAEHGTGLGVELLIVEVILAQDLTGGILTFEVDDQAGQRLGADILECQADGDLTGRVTLQQFDTHELHRTSGGIVVGAGLRHQGKILIHSYTYSLLLRVGLGVGRLGRMRGFGLFGRLHRCGRIRRRCYRLGGLAPAQVIRRQGPAFHQRFEFLTADLFALHKNACYLVQLVHVLGQGAAGGLIGLIHNVADLVVDLGRDSLRVALALAEVTSQEGLAGVTAVDDRPIRSEKP